MPLATIITSLFVANVTGRSHLPPLKRACGSAVLADAKTSAGAPRSICVCSTLEPRKLNVGAGSICVNTSRSDDAA